MRRIDPVLLLFSAAVLAVTIQKGIVLAHPGNFLLFRDTFHRLVSGADVYNPPAGEMTGFLYSPTFALLFAPFALLPLALGDRKSTRLNSSHRCISYAVFCLKKNKKQ